MSRMSTSSQPPRGMRDFYPVDMVLRNRIFDSWRTAAHRFGFAPYDSCVVESLDLLKRKAGEEIVEQIYAFKDKSGRELALRPEMTPTLARMVGARHGSLTFPIKWHTIAQCFRYERTTRGRKREHYQWNLDIVGEQSLLAEAEVIAAAVEALRLMGVEQSDIVIDFSSRALLADLFGGLGIDSAHHSHAFIAIDKRGKIPDDEIRELLSEDGLSPEATDRIFDVLAINDLRDVSNIVPSSNESYRALERFLEILDAYGLSSPMHFSIGVIRGLAYYTGIVFEAFDAGRTLRAIFGGGRYDNLLSDIAGTSATAVGLGFGDVVVAELLDMKSGSAEQPRLDGIAVGFMTPAQEAPAIRIATSLRGRADKVDLALSPEKAKKFFSRCNREGYAEAVYIGPDDVAAGRCRIKNLETREEREEALNAP